jgi:hypothetical protein
MLGSWSERNTSGEQSKNINSKSTARLPQKTAARKTAGQKKLQASGCFECDKVITSGVFHHLSHRSLNPC